MQRLCYWMILPCSQKLLLVSLPCPICLRSKKLHMPARFHVPFLLLPALATIALSHDPSLLLPGPRSIGVAFSVLTCLVQAGAAHGCHAPLPCPAFTCPHNQELPAPVLLLTAPCSSWLSSYPASTCRRYPGDAHGYPAQQLCHALER